MSKKFIQQQSEKIEVTSVLQKFPLFGMSQPPEGRNTRPWPNRPPNTTSFEGDHLNEQQQSEQQFRHNTNYGVPPQQHQNPSQINHHYPTNIPSISENYTVYPVGPGNFLKVYHTNENEQQQTFNNYELFSSNSFIPNHSVRTQQQQQQDLDNLQSFDNHATTNMIINQLVTNWTPNVSGTYSPFGEQKISFPNNSDTTLLTTPTSSDIVGNNHVINRSPIENGLITTNNVHQRVQTKTNGSFETNSHQEVKKRIVAEVKPMRMSYSDVLSKNVSINKKLANDINSNSIESINKMKNSKIYSEKKSSQNNNFNNNNEKKSHSSSDEKDQKIEPRKKIHTNNNKNDENQLPTSNLTFQKDKQRKTGVGNDDNNKENISSAAASSSSAKTIKKSAQQLKSKTKNTQTTQNDTTKRRSNNKRENDDNLYNTNSKENDKEFYYNITKNDTNSAERQYKIGQQQQQHQNNSGNGNATKKSSAGTSSSSTTSSSSSRQNSNLLKSTNFRNIDKQTFYYTKRNQRNRKNVKYELFTKLAEKWFEYTMKILYWLFYLFYDIIVLGFGMFYDSLKQSYSYLSITVINLRQELRNNSDKPNVWIKNLFKNIDNKFSKTSKFAIWRRFYKRNVDEPTQDFYKNGRLPQTGDEAMYSLLNCKGKDAYSILGVTTDSSQEQIRKHYKKIAVLVHPDKNKQPGAEEAFKVLQRAFELIGEPENRNSYNQSLAEALNAEKAWSELHELLSQLQSKIAEAANTIRCSSCGLRHPRKLTERPHYAARECSSCKIRHSAREGDIWAETSIFGLRWKYLALMEGKVYDITEWANCQKGALSHLQPNSHIVQYRIVRGGQQQQQQQQQEKERLKRDTPSEPSLDKERMKRDPPSEPSLDEFLDNLYSGQNPQNSQQGTSSRRRSKRN